MHNMLTASPAYMECVSEDTSLAFLRLVDMCSRRCLIGKEICCCWRVLESPFPRAVNSEGVGEGEGHPQIPTIGHHVASPCRATYIWGFCIEFLPSVMLLCPAYILYSCREREGKWESWMRNYAHDMHSRLHWHAWPSWSLSVCATYCLLFVLCFMIGNWLP